METKLGFKEAVRIAEEVNLTFREVVLPKNTNIIDLKYLAGIKYLSKKNGIVTMKLIKEEILFRHGRVAANKLDVRVTKYINRLVEKKMVSTRRTDEDRRIIEIIITNRGNNLLKTSFKEAEKLWKGAQNG